MKRRPTVIDASRIETLERKIRWWKGQYDQMVQECHRKDATIAALRQPPPVDTWLNKAKRAWAR